jgi:Ca2+-binding EF-hand superfamily protein
MVDLDRVNSIFDAIDADKSGEIDPTELMLHLLGVGQEHESVSALFKVLDKDGNGSISREEFIAGFDKLTEAESSEVVLKAKLKLSDEEYAELKADFDEIDTNKSGSVDISEVRTLLTKERNGTAPTEAEVEEMMGSFDKDADGQVTLVEYLAALGYAAPDLEAYDDLDAFEPPDQEADLEAAAALIQGAAAGAAPPGLNPIAASRLESSKVLAENSSVQAS